MIDIVCIHLIEQEIIYRMFEQICPKPEKNVRKHVCKDTLYAQNSVIWCKQNNLH